MTFEIVGKIRDITAIAKGPSVRERKRLIAQFGRGRWRKLKGVATQYDFGMGGPVEQRYTGTKLMVSVVAK